MNNSIKEILDDYKKLAGEITEKLDNTAEYESWLIIQDYVDEFLNYITNLQKENETIRDYYEYYKDLNGKNFKLARDFKDERDMYKDKFKNYKSRNEKAIEYIKNNLTISSILDGKTSYCLNDYSFDYKDLLNILEGGDE